MNKVTMTESHEPLGEDEVAALEQYLGSQLPSEYRTFLLAHNGGRPEPNAFEVEDYPGVGSILDWFLGIKEGVHNDISDHVEEYRGRIPIDLLPIAYDPGGNLVCLAVSGPRTGSVYFWDHEGEEEAPSYRNVYLIADRFDLFLDRLKPISEMP